MADTGSVLPPAGAAGAELVEDDAPSSPREPARWAVCLALVPTMLVLGLWVHSASDGWSYGWSPRPGVSRALGAIDGKVRFTEVTKPTHPPPPGIVTYRRFRGFGYSPVEGGAPPGGTASTTKITTVPIWALLVVALVPAALASRRRPRTVLVPEPEIPLATRHA